MLNLNQCLVGQSTFGCRFFFFITLFISWHSFLPCRLSVGNLLIILFGFHCILFAEFSLLLLIFFICFSIQFSSVQSNHSLDQTGLCWQSNISLSFFNMLSRLVIIFLSRSKRLNFMAAIIICSDFGAKKNKVSHCFHCFLISI